MALLHVKGYNNGFCFMLDDKAVSVQEALLANGGKFHKATVNNLNRNNLPNQDFVKHFDAMAEILHKGITGESARALLRNEFDIDVRKTEFMKLSSSQVEDLKTVFKICRYKLPSYTLLHSPMYYFHRYLQNLK